MPKPMRLARDVAFHVGEAVVVPLVLFYAVLVSAGLSFALLGALLWAYLVVVVRVVRGGRPPTLLLAAAGLATVKVVITAAASSAMVYFLQPTLATYLFAAALLVTIPLDQPLIQRLAHDFCPLPPEVVRSRPLRRFYQRLSLLWAAVLLVNASVTLGLLLTVPTTLSVPVAGVASVPAFLAGIAASYLWFRRSLREGGYVLAWGKHPHQ